MADPPDPRLNSIHLDPSRRQDFRQARKALLNSRGERTLLAETGSDPSPSDLHELLQSRPNALPAGAVFVLMDRQHTYPLKVGLNTVGRLPDNDVVVEDPYVSRRH